MSGRHPFLDVQRRANLGAKLLQGVRLLQKVCIEVEYVMMLAERHGFRLAPPHSARQPAAPAKGETPPPARPWLAPRAAGVAPAVDLMT